MRYWDASAIVPLIALQEITDSIRSEANVDPSIVTWWGTRVECASAVSRREREGVLDEHEAHAALDQLAILAADWAEIAPSARLRQAAERLLRVHPLRAGDALQLAAAIIAADGDPPSIPFVTLDDRLASAARREGFPVLPA
ncbi:MAG TPA: type II toxin-antitoxin system VapC family toxin [Candidatus Limnocylindria bacterium]